MDFTLYIRDDGSEKEFVELLCGLQKKYDFKLLNKALDESFDLFISDLYTENLSNHSTFFKLTNTKLGTKHFLIGIPLQTEYFKLGLGKEYDNFRSFPFNNEYRIDGIGSKEDSKTHTRLVPDFFGLEI